MTLRYYYYYLDKVQFDTRMMLLSLICWKVWPQLPKNFNTAKTLKKLATPGADAVKISGLIV